MRDQGLENESIIVSIPNTTGWYHDPTPKSNPNSAESSTILDNEMSEKVLNIMEFMDDLDDVQEVHTNAEFPDDFEVKN